MVCAPTRPFPSWKLLVPALSTRLIGTLVACYGLFMPAVGWVWVGWIYLYATIWFIFNDYVKVWTYKLMGPRADGVRVTTQDILGRGKPMGGS